ncbi:MAG TPA: hypothetical protein VGX23_23200 [Actinocrinis sp.]|nr:hypothetical protein [Actinocrinis sp.]
MTSQGWKSLLTPESSALARFRADQGAWRELAFAQRQAASGGGAGRVADPAAGTRTALLWAIQYDWQPGDLPLLRYLLAQQVLAAEHAGEGSSAWLDDLARAVRLVARGRDEGDVAQLYDAVRLLVTNPAQTDQSWVGYYSQLAALQSGVGAGHEDVVDASAVAGSGSAARAAEAGGPVGAGGSVGAGGQPGVGGPAGAGRPTGAGRHAGAGGPGAGGQTGARRPGTSGPVRAGTEPGGAVGGDHPRYFQHIGLGELTGPGGPGRPSGASVPGVLGDPTRLGPAGQTASADYAGAYPAGLDELGVADALDRLDAAARLGRSGSFDAFAGPPEQPGPAEPEPEPATGPLGWPQRSLEPATPYVAAPTPAGPTLPLLPPPPPPPRRPAGPGAGLLTEPAADRSIESQVSRAFMAGGAQPAVSVIGEWAANRPVTYESLNTQTELYASLGEYGAAADAARRLVALPDPDRPDPDLARFDALRRVARLERQSGNMDAAWRSLTEAQQDLAEHPHWRDLGPGQALATEFFLLTSALDPEEPLARAALKTGDKLARKLAALDEYLRQVALRAAEHCADERLRRRYDRPIG